MFGVGEELAKLAAQQADGVFLQAQLVLASVADALVHPASGGDRVGAHGVDLAHDPDRDALARRRERCALAGEAGADDQDVVFGHRQPGTL